MKLDKNTGIVMLNMGGPDSLEAVEPFLARLFADPLLIRLPWFIKPLQSWIAARVARSRARRVQHDYESIGGESPLARISAAQANAVADILGCEGYVAMRYWKPFAPDVVQLMKSEDIRRAVVISGYPQHSRSTSESSVSDFRAAWLSAGLPVDDVVFIERWYDHPGYVAAMASTLDETVSLVPDRDCHVLFTAHGLPEKYVRSGDTYEDEIRETLRLVVERAGLQAPWSLAFQSRVGPLKWLQPYTDDEIMRLGAAGVKNLVMVPLGFISDHIETLAEIDQAYASLARESGMVVYRVPSLNDRPDFIGALADLVRDRIREEGRLEVKE